MRDRRRIGRNHPRRMFTLAAMLPNGSVVNVPLDGDELYSTNCKCCGALVTLTPKAYYKVWMGGGDFTPYYTCPECYRADESRLESVLV